MGLKQGFFDRYGFSDGCPYCSFIVESVAILLMEVLGGDVVCWWSVRYSVVGLRVSHDVI